ncbi:hypothetical protein J3F83DRAFT_538547 [Trichoderma novae-zelandiae]
MATYVFWGNGESSTEKRRLFFLPILQGEYQGRAGWAASHCCFIVYCLLFTCLYFLIYQKSGKCLVYIYFMSLFHISQKRHTHLPRSSEKRSTLQVSSNLTPRSLQFPRKSAYLITAAYYFGALGCVHANPITARPPSFLRPAAYTHENSADISPAPKSGRLFSFSCPCCSFLWPSFCFFARVKSTSDLSSPRYLVDAVDAVGQQVWGTSGTRKILLDRPVGSASGAAKMMAMNDKDVSSWAPHWRVWPLEFFLRLARQNSYLFGIIHTYIRPEVSLQRKERDRESTSSCLLIW